MKKSEHNKNIDSFYPHNKAVAGGSFGVMLNLHASIRQHLQLAINGNRERESKLCNKIGQIRRAHPDKKFQELPDFIIGIVMESVIFLRSTGRKIDLGSDDPRRWISQRDGSPRW